LSLNQLDGTWQWLNGDVISADSNLWAPGEPNNKFGSEKCVGFLPQL